MHVHLQRHPVAERLTLNDPPGNARGSRRLITIDTQLCPPLLQGFIDLLPQAWKEVPYMVHQDAIQGARQVCSPALTKHVHVLCVALKKAGLAGLCFPDPPVGVDVVLAPVDDTCRSGSPCSCSSQETKGAIRHSQVSMRNSSIYPASVFTAWCANPRRPKHSGSSVRAW